MFAQIRKLTKRGNRHRREAEVAEQQANVGNLAAHNISSESASVGIRGQLPVVRAHSVPFPANPPAGTPIMRSTASSVTLRADQTGAESTATVKQEVSHDAAWEKTASEVSIKQEAREVITIDDDDDEVVPVVIKHEALDVIVIEEDGEAEDGVIDAQEAVQRDIQRELLRKRKLRRIEQLDVDIMDLEERERATKRYKKTVRMK